MKTTFALAVLLSVCPVLAQPAGHPERTISVNGEAEVKVVPDQAIISVGVEVRSQVLVEARREHDKRVRAIRAAVAKLGVADADFQTDFVQLGMQYLEDGITPKYYYTRKSIGMVVRDIQRLEDVLSAAVDAGATHIHGVELETTKLREFRDQARALAVQAATAKARDMAAAAGMSVIGGPTHISSAQYGARSWYGSGWGGRHGGMMTQNVVIDGGDSGTGSAQGALGLGRISVTATVSIQFRIQ